MLCLSQLATLSHNMSLLLATILTAATAVSAHGWIDNWAINGDNYTGYNPTIAPWVADQGTISWPAWNTDTGPV
jgi:cellulase